MNDGNGAIPDGTPVPAGPFDQAPDELRAKLSGGVYTDQDPQGTRARWLTGTLEAAGVELGDYDRRTVAWMGGWTPAALQAIGGWVTRASERAA